MVSCGDKRLGCGSGNFWQWILQLIFCLLLIMPVAAQAADLEKLGAEARDNKSIEESPENVLGYLADPGNVAVWQGSVDKLNNIAGVLPRPAKERSDDNQGGLVFDADRIMNHVRKLRRRDNTLNPRDGGIGNALHRGLEYLMSLMYARQALSLANEADAGEMFVSGGFGMVPLTEEEKASRREEVQAAFRKLSESQNKIDNLPMTVGAEDFSDFYGAMENDGLFESAYNFLKATAEMPGGAASFIGQSVLEFAPIISAAALVYLATRKPAALQIVKGFGTWIASLRRRTFGTLALWLKWRHRGRYTPPGLRSRRSPSRGPRSLMRKRRERVWKRG